MITLKLKKEQKTINGVLYERLNPLNNFNSVNTEKCELCGKIKILFEIEHKGEILYLCGDCVRDCELITSREEFYEQN